MAMKLRQFILGALLVGWLTPSGVLAQTGEYSVPWDDFANGFSVGAPGSKWFYFSYGPFVGNDGVVSPSAGGMYVSAAGSNPISREPAFTSTVAREEVSGLPGALDHVKWLAYMNHQSTGGYPGFDAQWSHQLACSTSINGATYGTQFHPFGTSVANAQDELRLANFAMNTIDFESFMVFDFMFTNERVYAIYERLPFGRTATNHYAAFTYAIPVATRTAWKNHQVKISYDRRESVVRWILDGVEVYSVRNVGYRLSRQYMLIDHGGTEQLVRMNQLNCGMGMFSLLDAASGSTPGLVRLSSTADFYYQPQVGAPQALTFVDEASQQGSRLFGQGATFHVGTYSVASQQILPAGPVAPPNIHFLIDTSGSMKELPQISNSNHVEFFNLTTNGCENPRLDAFAAANNWNPNFQYPVPDPGTGLGSDSGFPNLFQDARFYGYLYWQDLSNPPTQWDGREAACQSQVPDWAGTRAADYAQCLSCLSTKGYYKLPEAQAVNSGDLTNPNFIFWGRYLNFNPPKYVSVKAALKQLLKDVQGARVGMSRFASTTLSTELVRGQNPSCDQILSNADAFVNNRSSYINDINYLVFSTGTPLARSLLNVGYYFTSDEGLYRDAFGFGTAYSYPNSFRNGSLSAQGRSVCWGCQHNAVIIITDGEPTGDTLPPTIITKMRALNVGPVYCPDTQPCGSGPALSQRDKGATASYADDHSNYYLDDVAKMLANHDLQRNTPPIVGDFDTSGRQSLTVHTVGFGFQSNLLRNTAAMGGGLYYTADHADGLKQVLQSLLADAQLRANACRLYP
ncbi:MAG TPA: DUF6081 family protein [Myxococcaceae bacterium]|nr:DUF6081 family protein [Myxococcaceae bacterium]